MDALRAAGFDYDAFRESPELSVVEWKDELSVSGDIGPQIDAHRAAHMLQPDARPEPQVVMRGPAPTEPGASLFSKTKNFFTN